MNTGRDVGAELSPELVAVLASGSQHIRRPVYGDPGAQWHDHKGFNWMLLRKQLAERSSSRGLPWRVVAAGGLLRL